MNSFASILESSNQPGSDKSSPSHPAEGTLQNRNPHPNPQVRALASAAYSQRPSSMVCTGDVKLWPDGESSSFFHILHIFISTENLPSAHLRQIVRLGTA
ncbi:unnamed protein product [Dibothriocephalus latus]|uniref:Uncharacterized protein n=1 Tax=Dibothriocephalus latus TaxID=60516 RepID=A0A3P7NJK0_DIBLA|nr:unnamed protein product [Dibothriocephalus latus]